MGNLIHIRSLRAPTAISKVDSASGAVSATFSNRSLGAADPDRYLAIAVGLRRNTNDADVTSVTIAGVAATNVAYVKRVSSDRGVNSSIWIAKVPTGTTGDIVINAETGTGGWALYRLTGILSPTPIDTDTASSGNPLVMDLDVLERSIGIGGLTFNDDVTGTSWTGLDEDEEVPTFFCFASKQFTADEVARAVTVTCPNSSIACSSCAVWAPI